MRRGCYVRGRRELCAEAGRVVTADTSEEAEQVGDVGDNLVLVVGSYADAGAAAEDFKTLKSGEDAGEYKVVGAVVMNRDANGKVEVDEHGDKHVGHGAKVGGGVGLVVGLFAPPLLAATAIGAGIGAGIGALKKRHEEKQLGVDVDEYLPPGSSAVVAVVDDEWADKVESRPGQGRQADQQGDRLGRLRRAAEGDLAVFCRSIRRDHVMSQALPGATHRSAVHPFRTRRV